MHINEIYRLFINGINVLTLLCVYDYGHVIFHNNLPYTRIYIYIIGIPHVHNNVSTDGNPDLLSDDVITSYQFNAKKKNIDRDVEVNIGNIKCKIHHVLLKENKYFSFVA